MKVGNKYYRTVWMENGKVLMIDQNLLPFEFKIYCSDTSSQTCDAIKEMIVRGAGAIGVTAAYAMTQAFTEATQANDFWKYVNHKRIQIEATRPTARNLFYATERVYNAGKDCISEKDNIIKSVIKESEHIATEDIQASRQIGLTGNELIHDGYNIMTHCNAGWLAFTDYGTALSPIYFANTEGKKIHVFVDETRPRSQGARLTAWELKNENVPHTIIPDNAGAHIMAQGEVDMVIVGADRIAANGDVANKIGTFEKAIIAKEFNIPFYVAAPLSTFDLKCATGDDIPIESRSSDEVLYQKGIDKHGSIHEILVCSPGSETLNPAFDVTPAKYITGIITEKGIVPAKNEEIIKLF